MAMIDINWNPSRRELRQFAGLLAVLGPLAGTYMWWRHDAGTTGTYVAAAGLVLGGIGFALPALLRFVYVGWMIAVFPIGWTISHAILALIFYTVITPIGLVMRLVRRDPMHRTFDREAKTYWLDRDPSPPNARYFRQF